MKASNDALNESPDGSLSASVKWSNNALFGTTMKTNFTDFLPAIVDRRGFGMHEDRQLCVCRLRAIFQNFFEQ